MIDQLQAAQEEPFFECIEFTDPLYNWYPPHTQRPRGSLTRGPPPITIRDIPPHFSSGPSGSLPDAPPTKQIAPSGILDDEILPHFSSGPNGSLPDAPPTKQIAPSGIQDDELRLYLDPANDVPPVTPEVKSPPIPTEPEEVSTMLNLMCMFKWVRPALL